MNKSFLHNSLLGILFALSGLMIQPTHAAVMAANLGLALHSMKAQDQDAALKARKNAKLVPYGKITELIKREFGGRIAHQRLIQNKKGQWIYQLRVLNQQNKVMNIQVDAETGKIIKTQKGKK